MQDRNGFLNIFISVVLIFCDNHSLVKQSITDHPQDVLLHLSTFPEFPLHLLMTSNLDISICYLLWPLRIEESFVFHTYCTTALPYFYGLVQ